jgi:glycosyltransferase involved in cell wall biosynthesis
VNSQRRRRVLYGVTAPITASTFLRGQLAHLDAEGWDVHLVCGERGADDFAASERLKAAYVVPARRAPSPLDPLTLLGLWWRIMRVRPDAVVMGTPKVGVLGVLAAKLARVPHRTYLVHGYRAEGLTGPRRHVMRALERLACWSSTHVVAVSPSLRQLMLQDRAVRPDKVVVFGSGSANGVDLARFAPVPVNGRQSERASFDLPLEAQVVACVGRVGRDKGLLDLPNVWERISHSSPRAWLLVVGDLETRDTAEEMAWRRLINMDRVRYAGHVAEVERAYRASDLLMFLTHREGLGMVALEAGACRVPTVGFAVTGVVDAVADGLTGVLVPVGDLQALEQAVVRLLADPEALAKLGAAARLRVERAYDQKDVWSSWADHLSAAVAVAPEGSTIHDA